ncbi:amidase [Epidermidibacterium keratini]
MIERIEAGDGEINAVVVRDFDRALEQAAYADQRLAAGERAPLLGLPMTVKESIDIAGLRSTWGMPEHADHVASRDAVVVDRLRAAGAVIVGKTNVSPALADLQAVNEVYGATHNPYLHGRTPGGSSGGSAAALAAGFTSLEVGSDIGGSIRLPAGFCGVWGLKPTYGAVSMQGHYLPGTDGADLPLGVGGPLARSADDLALLLSVLADHPLAGPRNLDTPRVAVVAPHPVAPIGADVAAAVDATVAALEALGAQIDRAPQLPDLQTDNRRYVKLLNTALAHGASAPGREPLSASDWLDLLDEQARAARAWDDVLADRYDYVLAPTFSRTAFPIDDTDIAGRTLDVDGEAVPCATQLAWAGMATYSGLPAVSFPAGRGNDDLPIGLQLIGPRHGDLDVIDLAARVARG